MAHYDSADFLRIDPVLIQEEYVRLPADIAYWNACYADAFEAWALAKSAREQAYHRLMSHHRDLLEQKGKSRVTIGEVESQVFQDSQYIAARSDEIDSEAEKLRVHGVVEGLRAKKDMLVSLGAHMRLEMEHDPVLRQRANLDKEIAQGRS